MRKEKTKENRIKDEDKRLRKIYDGIETKRYDIVDGLIVQAARLRITLDDMSVDLDANGYIEKFQQSKDVEPYERRRPTADLYNTMNTSYQKCIKQLTDLLPKEPITINQADEFEDFVNGREDI